MLLSLEGHELLDIVGLHRRQLDKTRESGLTRNRIADLGFAQLEALHEVGDRHTALRYPRGFKSGVGDDRFRIIGLEHKISALRGLEDGNADALRSDIESDAVRGVGHDAGKMRDGLVKPCGTGE